LFGKVKAANSPNALPLLYNADSGKFVLASETNFNLSISPASVTGGMDQTQVNRKVSWTANGIDIEVLTVLFKITKVTTNADGSTTSDISFQYQTMSGSGFSYGLLVPSGTTLTLEVFIISEENPNLVTADFRWNTYANKQGN